MPFGRLTIIIGNVRLERIQQTANDTAIFSPDKSKYIFVGNDGWGALVQGGGRLALSVEGGGTGAGTPEKARDNLGITTLLDGKQTKDNTLTNLSGKTVSQLLDYLGVGYTCTGVNTPEMIYTLPGGVKIQIFTRSLGHSQSEGVITTTPLTFPQAFPGGVWGVFASKKTFVQVATSCEVWTRTGFNAITAKLANTSSPETTSETVFIAIGW